MMGTEFNSIFTQVEMDYTSIEVDCFRRKGGKEFDISDLYKNLPLRETKISVLLVTLKIPQEQNSVMGVGLN